MKTFILVVFLILFTTTSCSVMEKFAQENPALFDIGMKILISKYIEKENNIESIDARKDRATEVHNFVLLLEDYLTGNPMTTIASLKTVVNKNIPWDEMELSDRIAIQVMIGYIQKNSNKSDVPVSLRELLFTIKNTAALYM